MPKRQSKTKSPSRKRDKMHILHVKKFSFSLLIGIALVVTLFSFDTVFTPSVTAKQPSAPSTLPLLSQNFILSQETASPSVKIENPILAEFEKSLQETVASTPAAQPTETPDYCLDLPVVMYHHIQPLQIAELLGHAPLTVDATIFDEQVKYLKEQGYTAVSTEDLVSALYNRQSLPHKSIMLTIDDGYDDNYTYAFMTAKKYQMIVNFMIPTGLIEKPGYMTWDHLREMAQNPYARLYNHTTSHAALGALSKEGIMQEVGGANTDFEQKLGIKNTIITYPYGSYNDLAMETLKEMGMRAAITTEPGNRHCLSNIMRLPRVRVANAPMASYGF